MKKTFLETAHEIAAKLQNKPDKALNKICNRIVEYIDLALPGRSKTESCLIHDKHDVVCIIERENDIITQCSIFDQPRGHSMTLIKASENALWIDYRTDNTKEKSGDIRDLFKPIVR